MSGPPPLGLTMGEPAGIAAEITLKAWLGRSELSAPFVAIDDADRLRRVTAALGLDVPIAVVDTPEAAAAVFGGALPVLSHPLAAEVTPGRPDPANAPAVIGAIDRAVEKQKFWVFPGATTGIGWRLRRFFPGLMWWIDHRAEGY